MDRSWVNDLQWLQPGLIAVTGGERSGKTSLLRSLCGDPAATGSPAEQVAAAHPDAQWIDLTLPAQNDETPGQIWDHWQARCAAWDTGLHAQLVQALNLTPHRDKKIYMLSAGSRRKVALAGLLACGATVTCLDQPYAALDAVSIGVLRSFLQEAADHPSRTWVVADYEADPQLPWRQVISLD